VTGSEAFRANTSAAFCPRLIRRIAAWF